MKKTYFSPCLRTLRLGSGTMMNSASATIGAKENPIDATEQASDIFWSKTFGGTIIDDTNSSSPEE